jgi:hypothetical protein
MHHNQRHGHTGLAAADRCFLVLWSSILIVRILPLLLDFWEVNETGIRYRRLWYLREIPFAKILATRLDPNDVPTRKPSGNLEIELAPKGPGRYPHTYMIARPRDWQGFLQAVESYAPQTLTPA